MNINTIANSNTLTMGTREIASMLNKEHSNIKRSAKRLSDAGVLTRPLDESEFIHAGNIYTEYLLNKRDCIVLVAQNSPEFTAKIVDRWYELESGHASVKGNLALPDELYAAEWSIKMLGLEGSAKLLAVSTVLEGTKVHAALPQYAIDSPTGIGSSEPTKNLTELLKENGYKVSAKAANKILQSIGFIEQLERKSTGDKTKRYWSVTDKGSAYGKNVTSPQNQKQTQPHWYVSKFNELAEAMGI